MDLFKVCAFIESEIHVPVVLTALRFAESPQTFVTFQKQDFDHAAEHTSSDLATGYSIAET